jgi:hypothetical protein
MRRGVDVWVKGRGGGDDARRMLVHALALKIGQRRVTARQNSSVYFVLPDR